MPWESVGGGVSPPKYEESQLVEKRYHWYSLFKNRQNYLEYMMNHPETADEISASESAMKAITRLEDERTQ
jgi:hypothetical protein